MKLTRRAFIQAAGAVVSAGIIGEEGVFAADGGAMQSPVINPVYLTGSLEDWPLAELASMGYKGLEITPACLKNVGAWKSKAQNAHLRLVCVNAIPDLTPYLTGSLHDGVERRRRATVDHLLGVLREMNVERIGYLLVAPGRLAENYQKPEQARALFVSGLRELLSSAGEAVVLVESLPRRLFATSAELASIIDEVSCPNVAAALDVGHAAMAGEKPADAARTLGHRLRYVQLHDADARPDRPRLDRHLPLGAGSVDTGDVKNLARDRLVSVNVTAPADPVTAARSALARLLS